MSYIQFSDTRMYAQTNQALFEPFGKEKKK